MTSVQPGDSDPAGPPIALFADLLREKKKAGSETTDPAFFVTGALDRLSGEDG